MPIASLEELCCAVCELGGAPVPPLVRDDEGNLGVALAIDGVEITLTHEPQRSASHVFVLAAAGPLPVGDELATCRALMDVNAALMNAGSACFSVHPHTRDVTLQHSYALDEASPQDFYGRLRELAGLILRYRSGSFTTMH